MIKTVADDYSDTLGLLVIDTETDAKLGRIKKNAEGEPIIRGNIMVGRRAPRGWSARSEAKGWDGRRCTSNICRTRNDAIQYIVDTHASAARRAEQA